MWWWFFTSLYHYPLKLWFKCKNAKNAQISFYGQFDFSLQNYFLHIWPTHWIINSSPMSKKKKSNMPKRKFSFPNAQKNEFCYLHNFHMVYNKIKCIQWTLPYIQHYLSIKKYWHELHYLMNSFLFLLKKLNT